MKDYSEDVLKIQEAGRKLPELIMEDKNAALLFLAQTIMFLAQTIISAQQIIEYLNEPANE